MAAPDFSQCAFLFSLVENVHDTTRCFTSAGASKVSLSKWRAAPWPLQGEQRCGQRCSRIGLKVGAPVVPAKPRCEAMWLAIAPSVLLFWLQSSKRPHGVVRRCSSPPLCLGSGSLTSRRFSVGNMAELPTVWSCTSSQGGQGHGCTESIRVVRIVRANLFPESSNFVIRNVEVLPNEKIGSRVFVLHVGRRVCFFTRQSVVPLIALL